MPPYSTGIKLVKYETCLKTFDLSYILRCLNVKYNVLLDYDTAVLVKVYDFDNF